MNCALRLCFALAEPSAVVPVDCVFEFCRFCDYWAS